jgi:hypothetical protein
MDHMMIQGGMRWLLDGPLETSFDGTLEQIMDAFLDRHLWFLPVPRYGRKYFDTVTEETIVACLKIMLDNIDDHDYMYDAGRNATEILFAAYKLWPQIENVFQSSVDNKIAVYTMILMALDLKTSRLLEPSKKNFETLAEKVIFDEIEGLSSFEDLRSVLTKASDFLDARHHKTMLSTLPRTEEPWHPYLESKERGLVSLELENTCEALCTMYEDFLPDFLRAHLHIKSLLDEKPDIAFFFGAT